MLSNTLNTNEVKDSAGSEVEFQSIAIEQRKHTYGSLTETPALPYRLSVSHQETGIGIKRRRRSAVRVDKTVISTVDNVSPVQVTAVAYIDAPVGALAASTEIKNVLANLISVLASDGSNATIKYDCTGTAAAALVSGGL